MPENHDPDPHESEGIRLLGSGAGTNKPDGSGEPNPAGSSDPLGWRPASSDSLAWPPKPAGGHPLSEPDQSGGWALPDASGPIDVGSLTGPAPMQSWTDPPTGQVPAIIAGDDEDDMASRTSGSPRWRGRGEWGEGDFSEELMATEGTRIGAMDESKPDPADMFNFDDPRRPAPPTPAPVWGEGHVPPTQDEPGRPPFSGAQQFGDPDPSGGVGGSSGSDGWVFPDQNPGFAASAVMPVGGARNDAMSGDVRRIPSTGPGADPSGGFGPGPDPRSGSQPVAASEYSSLRRVEGTLGDEYGNQISNDPHGNQGRQGLAPGDSSFQKDPVSEQGVAEGAAGQVHGSADGQGSTPGGNWGSPDAGWTQDPSGAAPVGTAQIRTRQNRVIDPPAGTETLDGRDMGTAAIVGGVLLLVSIAVFGMGWLWMSALLVTILVLGCAVEVFAAVQRAGLRPATFLGWVSVVSMMVAVYLRGVNAIPLVMGLTFLATMLWYLFGVVHGRPLVGISTTIMAVVWTGVLGSFATAILHDGSLGAYVLPDKKAGVIVLFGAVMCGVAYDIGGLLIGSLFGTRRIAPHISPGKTIEGTAGGFVLAVVAGLIVGLRSEVWGGLWHGLALGLVAGLAAIAGDLCQSLVKRDLGIKDMGVALPGHGGFLDRFDSVLFVLPCVYYLAAILLAP